MLETGGAPSPGATTMTSGEWVPTQSAAHFKAGRASFPSSATDAQGWWSKSVMCRRLLLVG